MNATVHPTFAPAPHADRPLTLIAVSGRGVVRAVRAADGTWAVARPDVSGHVTAVAADAHDARRLWAGTRDGGVLRSDDGGRSWRSAGLGDRHVKAVSVSPHDANVVIAGTKPAAVFRTVDGGATWHELEGFRAARRWFWASPAEPPSLTPYVSAVAVSPVDPSVLLAGIEAGAVVRSEDGGVTWSDHRRRADRDCHDLRFHPRQGAWAYEAGGGGPAVSRDGGATWRHATAGLDGRYAVACAADPERPEVWYVAASPLAVWPRPWRMPIAHVPGEAHAGLYRSSAGAPWRRLGGGLPRPLNHMAYGLATDPHAPGHLYAGLGNGEVWHSPDHGDAWARLPLDLGSVRGSLVVA